MSAIQNTPTRAHAGRKLRRCAAILATFYGAALLAGYAALQTRPGHPDSYGAGFLSDSYYTSTSLKSLTWPTQDEAESPAGPAQIARLRQNGVPIRPLPPIFSASNVPRDVWVARGAAWNRQLQYLAANFKAGDIQDYMAVPIFGTAIATAALGIAKSSTVSVAATGLAGTSLYGGYKYAHPDADAAADKTAAFALRCLVDQTYTLETAPSIPLLLDKAALLDALNALTAATTSDSTVQAAVTAAQTAAKQTLSLLDTDIKLYNNMPKWIQASADEIDKTAQTSGTRTLDYSSILNSLSSSSSNKRALSDAKSSNQTAKELTSKAKKTKKKDTATDTKPAPSTNLDSVTKSVTGSTIYTPAAKPVAGSTRYTAAADPAPSPKTDPSKGGSNEITATKLQNTLSSGETSTLEKVLEITTDANEDLNVIDYSITEANIEACQSGQPAVKDPTTSGTEPSSDSGKSGG